MDQIIYVCDICDTEIDGEYCAEHPNASISSVIMPEIEAHLVYRLCCDRCEATASGAPEAHVHSAYLIDDPYMATGNLCPGCATDDNPQHIPGSWLLIWG